MKTPLYEAHVARGARMAPFAGWDMPIQYDGILQEHEHTRRRVSVFDTCHMGEFELEGPTAEADLERLVTQAVGTLAPGQCRYGYLLRDDGGVLDDLTCYRLGPQRFMLCVNAGTCAEDAAWIRGRLAPTTRFADRSPETGKLDVQGPASRAELERALGVRLPDLKYFHAAEVELLDYPVLVSRSGYTGEWGYELYCPAATVRAFWDQLLAGGVIRPAGLGARDTLRLEMGYPLYGHELSPRRTPVAAARGQFVRRDKEFVGRAAVARDLEQGCPRYLAALRLAGRAAARAGDVVLKSGAPVGEVTSGSLAPSLGLAVALAYVDAAWCRVGETLEIRVRDRALPAVVTDLPFYRSGTARGVHSSAGA